MKPVQNISPHIEKSFSRAGVLYRQEYALSPAIDCTCVDESLCIKRETPSRKLEELMTVLRE